MGGVAKEIDRFRSAFYRDDAAVDPYRDLLDAVETELITDVIAGTSAGGINGALLGYVVARGTALDVPGEAASTDEIRNTWEKLGAIDELLEQSRPASALNDEFLFQGCADVFDRLRAHPRLENDPPTRMRLTVTATDSAGYPLEVAGVAGRDHRLEMSFRAVPYPEGEAIRLSRGLRDAIARAVGEDRSPQWPFPPPSTARDLCAPDAAALLARAARTTASFPIAFAPSTLPLAAPMNPIPGDTCGLTATPSMREVITTRGAPDVLAGAANRYAVDGGLWDNAPFEAVLRSIERAPAARDVDRRLVYVIYTAEDAVREGSSSTNGADQPPALIGSVTHTLTTPSNVSFANDLERIARDTARQSERQRRVTWLLKDGKPDVFELTEQLLPVYVTVTNSPDSARTREALSAGGRPLAELSLDDWGATPANWAWGTTPVQVAIDNGRRLLRDVLTELAADATEQSAATMAVIEARDVLSQLAWALSDLADRRDSEGALTEEEREVCGFAMAQFAETMSGLHPVLGGLPVPAIPEGDPSAIAIALSVSDGGEDLVVKRAIATEIAMHALGADERPHKVDYRFETIRPVTSWPLTPAVKEPGERPPLQGLRYRHFGGFLLTSWRLSDWMWGRLDASTRIVDMLLDGRQFQRLTAGRPAARAELASKLATLAIPTDGVDPTRTRYLAHCAFAGPGLTGEPGAQADPQTERGAPSEAEVEAWRGRLAQTYADVIANTPEDGKTSAELVRLRADVRRRLQYAILDDERPDLIKQINQERADSHLRVDDAAHLSPLDEASLSAELDGGLHTLAEALASKLPNTVLASYAERAVSNTLEALNHPAFAGLVRAAGAATSAAEALRDAEGAITHYIDHIRHRR
jgi:hypothetical protein